MNNRKEQSSSDPDISLGHSYTYMHTKDTHINCSVVAEPKFDINVMLRDDVMHITLMSITTTIDMFGLLLWAKHGGTHL